MTFIQRRINVDATSWRLYNVELTSMQPHDVIHGNKEAVTGETGL